MLIGIIADLHANLEATQAVLRDLDHRNVDKIVCLGDLTGYNANPNEVVDLVRERGIPTVMGNHDAAVCGLEDPWFFRDAAKQAIEWQFEQLRDDNKRWLATAPERISFNCCCIGVHGSPGSRDEYIIDWLDAMRQMDFMNGKDAKICFFGHSHKPSFFGQTGNTPPIGSTNVYQLSAMNRYLINPGAVGQPRDRDWRAAFGIFDTEKMSFEFARVTYEIDMTVRKIMNSGLPAELGRRLLKGK